MPRNSLHQSGWIAVCCQLASVHIWFIWYFQPGSFSEEWKLPVDSPICFCMYWLAYANAFLSFHYVFQVWPVHAHKFDFIDFSMSKLKIWKHSVPCFTQYRINQTIGVLIQVIKVTNTDRKGQMYGSVCRCWKIRTNLNTSWVLWWWSLIFLNKYGTHLIFRLNCRVHIQYWFWI